ncbi:MAG: rhodanese-like domain-containing protein [Gammaproteobacteria bacterium]
MISIFTTFRSHTPFRRALIATPMLIALLAFCLPVNQARADNKAVVQITDGIPFVDVDHQGTPVRISRIQDTENRLVDDFSKTSRACPPFCIHPMEAAAGVKTVSEVELLNFLQQQVANEDGLLIDARMPNWYESETIPGAVNIPFVIFTKPSAKRERVLELLGGIKDKSGNYDLTHAKALCLFCNGPWCDQSPRAINGLIAVGYPPEKLSYYRGGMQLWKLFGLTTVLPESHAIKE